MYETITKEHGKRQQGKLVDVLHDKNAGYLSLRFISREIK